MYQIKIEIHANTRKCWGRLDFVDSTGKLHTRNVELERNDTANGNAIYAAIIALRILEKPCVIDIHTDNEYMTNAMVNGWAYSWKENEWNNAKGKPVKHREQWEELLKLLARHSYRFATIDQ